MLRYLPTMLVAVCLVCLPLAGCQATEGYDPSAALAQAWADARHPDSEEGVAISAAEAEVIRQHADAAIAQLGENAKRTDWGGTLAGVGLAAGGAISTRLLGFDVFKFIYPMGNKKPPLGRFANVSVDNVPVEQLADDDPKNPKKV